MPRLNDIPGTESYIKRHAVKYARACGFIVIDTATNRRNARAGIPDVFVGHVKFPNEWSAVDFKSPKGKPTLAQQTLVDVGMLDIVDGVPVMVNILRKRFPGVT